MILLLRADATPEQREAVLQSLRGLGLEAVSLREEKGEAYEIIGENRGQALALTAAPGVQEILTRRRPLVGGEPIWPHFALRVAMLALFLIILLCLLTAVVPPPLGDRPGPRAGIVGKPVEWYLAPLDAFIRKLSGASGVLMLSSWVLLFLWPFLDRADPRNPAGRRMALLVRAMGLLVVLFVLILGVTA